MEGLHTKVLKEIIKIDKKKTTIKKYINMKIANIELIKSTSQSESKEK